MRVLQVNEFGTLTGGVEGYIADVARALIAAGHETHLVSFAAEDPGALMPHTTQVIGADPKDVLARVDRVIADYHPDVAYLHAIYDPRILRHIVGSLPAVSYIHGPYTVCPGNALFLRRSRQVCRRTAGPGCLVMAQIERCCFGRNPIRHVRHLHQVRSLLRSLSQVDILVGSSYMQQRLIANGLQTEKVSLLPPVIFDHTDLAYVPPPDPGTILFAGRITLEKGLGNLIRALAPLPGPWRLVVAGDGPDRADCERLAEQLGVAGRIVFAGWVTPTEMGVLYQRCGFVVMPSLWPEPYGRIGPEAFRRGRPAVGYAVGGIPDWLEDGRTGYLVAPGDVDNLRDSIERLMRDQEGRERMGRAALERAAARWSSTLHVEKLVMAFRAAIDRSRGEVSKGAR